VAFLFPAFPGGNRRNPAPLLRPARRGRSGLSVAGFLRGSPAALACFLPGRHFGLHRKIIKMQLPTFWRRASFTVAESAALVGVTEDALRGWLARNTFNDFNGAKTGYRLYLSALDCYYYLLVKQFTQFGVPVRTAMFAATQYANEAAYDWPDHNFLVVRTDGSETDFKLTEKPEFDGQTTLVVPLRALAQDLLEAAAIIYATEESAPAHKLGTVNGRPIAKWAAGVEAELAKMPVNQ
jgi:hypothetical protein